MANKRLSDLSELVAANLQPDDLFYVVDVSTNVLEGKKIRAGNIQTYVLNDGRITGSITYALLAATASYVDLTNVDLGDVISSSYSLSSSWADRTFFSSLSDTSSYIKAYEVDGVVFQATSSFTASYLFYNGSRPNGTASYALLALSSSYVKSSSYLIYTGVPNGIAFLAITASYSYTASLAQSASFLVYDGITPNGTASYARSASVATSASYIVSSSYSFSSSYAKRSDTCIVSETSNFLNWDNPTTQNGTSSYNISSSHALLSDSASYLVYDGITPNGTSSYSVFASSSFSSSYAISSSRSETTFVAVSASYALTSSYPLLDPNQYKVYGPFNTNDGTYGAQTSTELSYRNFIINPPGSNTTIFVQALCDVKVPITTTDSDAYTVDLNIEDWTNGVFVGSFTLDTSRPNNYINFSVSGALTGYSRTSTTLMGSNTSIQNISGSWYTLRVKASNGASFDVNTLLRGAQFFIYTKPDTIVTRTTYPPF